ncbi:unnamed protein product [Bathycoccus prasinos]
MDLNSALREEFDALKKSSAAHSIPHAQLQAAWARTMERALESLERKDEAIERYREKEEELERKIETLSEEVGRWKEAMAEEEEECTLAVKKYREIQDVMEYAIDLYPDFSSQFCEAKERLRESQKTSYRGEGPSPLWKGIFDAKKPDLLHKLLRTDAREKNRYTGETFKALGSNEIKFLYKTHPDSRNALKKLKVPIPGSYKYSQFPEECSAVKWARNLFVEHEMQHPDYSSGGFSDELHEWILGDLGIL